MRDYSMLPVTMESTEIEALADELLDLADSTAPPPTTDVAEALIQLIERQADNYAPFSDRIAARIQHWVSRVWSDADPDLDDALCTVLASVPTPEGRELLANATRSPNSRVRELAAETLADMERGAQERR
jgi:hypothetical protein